jgi:diguanylate cyclase (GGDEF)-like protein
VRSTNSLNSPRRILLLNLAALVAYGVLAGLSHYLVGGQALVPGIWFPSGLMAALALRCGPTVLPGLWLGASLVGALSSPGPLGLHAALGLATCLEPMAVLLLAPRLMRSRDPMDSLHDFAGFYSAAAIGLALSIGTTGLLQPAGPYAPLSFILHLAGVLSLAPLLLAVPEPGDRAGLQRLVAELRQPDWWALLLAITVSTLLINGGFLPTLSLTPLALLFPLLLVAGFRFSSAAATGLNLLAALLQTSFPFVVGEGLPSSSDLLLRSVTGRLFCGLLLLVLMVLVTNQQHRRMRAGLEQQARRLEEVVAARTQDLTVANARLERLSHLDSLTGIPNRRGFQRTFDAEWQRALRHQLPLTVGMLDVDHFKAYNDLYGHPAGDRCLEQIAAVLAAELGRRGELVARYGGEEFVLLLPGLPLEALGPLGDRLRSSIHSLGLTHSRGGPEGLVTISLGLATAVPRDGLTPEDLLAAADALLYKAKDEGRNRVCLVSLPL